MSSITLAPVVPYPVQKEIRSPWIISQREDLIWFIGSALAGYLAVALMWLGNAIGHLNQFLLPIQFVWFFAIDNPHVVATATRTYFDKEERHKLGWLLAVGAACLALGWLAGEFVCPIVKRIWTPSWVLYSAGWTFAMLAGFFWIIDIQGWRRWALPLVIVGMNSIAMYCMSQLMRGWVNHSLVTHLGPAAVPTLTHVVAPLLALCNIAVDPVWLNNTFGPVTQAAAVLLVLWLICWWMYRRGIFLRI